MKAYMVDLYKRKDSGMFERVRREYIDNENAAVREIVVHIEYGVDGAGVMQEVNVNENEMESIGTSVLAVDPCRILVQDLKDYYKKAPVLFSMAKIDGRHKNNYIRKSKRYVVDCPPY